MEQFLLLAIVTCSVLTPVHSIQCYVCRGKDSYCKNKRAPSSECSIRYNMDTCYKKIPTNYTGEITVTKLCHVKSECYEAQRLCEASGKCSVYCCFTDLCNGSNEMVSSVTHAQKWMIFVMQVLTLTWSVMNSGLALV